MDLMPQVYHIVRNTGISPEDAHDATQAVMKLINEHTVPAGSEAQAINRAAQTIKDTGGAVEIAGLRITLCNEFGERVDTVMLPGAYEPDFPEADTDPRFYK